MSRVTISMKAARALLEHLDRYGHDAQTPVGQAREELRRAMEPRRKPRKPLGLFAGVRKMPGSVLVSPRPTKAQKRDRRASIREECVQRSGGRCENPDCKREASQHYPNHWDHLFGRARAESLETTWMLCPDCDYLKTVNDPSASAWLDRFARHAREYAVRNPFRRSKYLKAAERAEERLAFVETRSMLGAGLKERHQEEAEKKIQELEQKVHKAVFGEETQR